LRAACAALTLSLTAAACSGGDDDSVADAAAVSSSAPATTSGPSTTAASSSTTTGQAESTTTTAETATSATEAPTTSEEATTTTTPPEPVYPLTGVGDPDPTIAARKVLVVKIGNEPAARPQTGLQRGRHRVGGDRQRQPDPVRVHLPQRGQRPVGPIRSGRLQDIDLFGSFSSPLFAWSGGNATVTRSIDGSDLINIGPNHANVYFRTRDRRAPSNLYSNTTALRTYAPFGAPAPPQQFLYRDPASTPQGEPSLGVEVTLDAVDVDWTWNPDEGLYFRQMEGRPHNDAASGQVTTNNVVVLEMTYLPGISRSPDAQSIGSGEAFVFTGGHYIHGYWERFDRTQPFQLYTDDNQPILLAPGRTFIELPRDENTVPLGTL
jgi:hypothetical protein